MSESIDGLEARRIKSAEDFIDAIGDIIEAGALLGVMGIDDMGAADGYRALVLRLNDERGTSVELKIREAPAERWAKVEVVGHREHVGRISEEEILGTPFLRVEALRPDGSFEVTSYGRAAIFSVSPRTEAEARRDVVPLAWRPCVLEGGGHDFTPSGALPSACAHCGYDLQRHERSREERDRKAKKKAADDAPDSDDEIPFPEGT